MNWYNSRKICKKRKGKKREKLTRRTSFFSSINHSSEKHYKQTDRQTDRQKRWKVRDKVKSIVTKVHLKQYPRTTKSFRKSSVLKGISFLGKNFIFFVWRNGWVCHQTYSACLTGHKRNRKNGKNVFFFKFRNREVFHIQTHQEKDRSSKDWVFLKAC